MRISDWSSDVCSSDLATTGLAGHGDTGGLDLAGGDPTRLESLDPVLAEGDLAATLGLTLHATALLLAVLDLLGHQHLSHRPRGGTWGSRCGRARGARSPLPRREIGRASGWERGWQAV